MRKRARIAVFRAIKLGDFLTATPAFRSLRAGFPNAEITLIGLPWAAPLVNRFRHYFDRFVEFPGYPGMDEIEVSGDLHNFFCEQRASRYDLAIQMHGAGPACNDFIHDLGATQTVGLYQGEQPSTISIGAPYPDNYPEVYRNLLVINLLGCPDRGTSLEFPLFQEDRVEADHLLEAAFGSNGPMIGIHPGSGGDASRRRWYAQGFSQVADELVARFGASIVITGERTEAALSEFIASEMQSEPLNLVGKTSLGGVAAVIAALDLFICNDTGTSHIADALATPSVTVFGSANPRRWGSLNQMLHPLLRPPVEPKQVVEVASFLLQKEYSKGK